MTYYLETDTLLFNDDGDEDDEEGVTDCDKRMFFQSSLLYRLDNFISIK